MMLHLNEVDLSGLHVESHDAYWLNVTMAALKNESKSKIFTLLSTTKSLLEERERSRYKLVEQILEILTADEENTH